MADIKHLFLTLDAKLHQQLKLKALQSNIPLYKYVILLLQQGVQ